MRVALLLLILSFAHVPDACCQSVQSNPHNQQQPAPTKAIENAPSTAPDQRPAPEDIKPRDKQYSVAIKEMPPKETWDKAYIFLTGALVIVAIFTLIAVWIQAVQTKHAADATSKSAAQMVRSVSLQELAFEQWVALENWRSKGVKLRDENDINAGGAMSIEFDIVNQTTFPLTVTEVEVAADDNSVRIGQPHLLLPSDSYESGVYVRLNDARLNPLGEIAFTQRYEAVTVKVSFTDILKRSKHQEFLMGCAVISQHKVDFHRLSPSSQRKLTEEERKNPNQDTTQRSSPWLLRRGIGFNPDGDALLLRVRDRLAQELGR